MHELPEKVVTCDVLIVGGGAAGLTGAAAAGGLKTILVERQKALGGKTALASGMIWMPGNRTVKSCPILKPHQLTGCTLQARAYVENAVAMSDEHGNGALPTTVTKRIDAFLTKGPEMIDFLRGRGFRWMKARPSFPDHQPELDGALPAGGRTLDPAIFDIESLGSLGEYLSHEGEVPLVFRFEDFRILTRPFASLQDFLKISRMRLRSWLCSLYFKRPASMGRSLVGQLLSICRDNGSIDIYTETELVGLWHEDGAVVGVSLEKGKETFKVRALRGVLLATSDFDECRGVSDVEFPSGGNEGNTTDDPKDSIGHVVALCQGMGAEACVTREVGVTPTMKGLRTGRTTHAIFEISKPFSIVVDYQGNRFFAESKPHGDAARSMRARADARLAQDARAWLVLDQNYRKRYTLGGTHRWTDITKALSKGILLEAETIGALADKMGIARQALESTIRRWNEMCGYGTDIHHKRGDDDYQRFMGDPRVAPNSCMGAIERAPFYAVRISTSDGGRKKRLLTDEHGRVLQSDGRAIPGLYAAGDTSACVLRATSLGAGGTLASTMVFAYTAVQHMSSQSHSSPTVSSQGPLDEKIIDGSEPERSQD
ncbi:FAD-binding-2 domain-containing protein [Fusarium keratoplasticum]|nr:FAD-binding-2 domain-containing protein [Fusarium keratoplasticum]